VDLTQLLSNPGPWTIIAVVLLVLYLERKALVGLFRRRQALAVEATQAEMSFEQRAREKLLTNGDYSKELTAKLMAMYQAEREERRTLGQQLLATSQAAERLSSEAIGVMKQFAEIARMQSDRQDQRDGEFCNLLREMQRVLDAVGFVLARLYFRNQSGSFQDLVVEIEGQETG
jgi:hypothetical protein